MKAKLVIDMPERCSECQLSDRIHAATREAYWCCAFRRATFCPLVPIEEGQE